MKVKGILKSMFEYYVYCILLVSGILCVLPPLGYEAGKYIINQITKLFK